MAASKLETGSNIFTGKTYNYTPGTYDPTKYTGISAYGGYSSPLLGQAKQTLSQQMTGQLSPYQQQILDLQLKKGLAATREGSYGMPVGAQKGIEVQQAGESALSAAELAGKQQQWAVGQSLGYEQMGQQDVQYGYGQGAAETARQNAFQQSENQYGQTYNEQQQQMAQQYQQMSGQGGLFGAVNAVGGKILGSLGGRLSGAVSNAVFGDPMEQQLELYKKYGMLGQTQATAGGGGGWGGGYSQLPGFNWNVMPQEEQYYDQGTQSTPGYNNYNQMLQRRKNPILGD